MSEQEHHSVAHLSCSWRLFGTGLTSHGRFRTIPLRQRRERVTGMRFCREILAGEKDQTVSMKKDLWAVCRPALSADHGRSLLWFWISSAAGIWAVLEDYRKSENICDVVIEAVCASRPQTRVVTRHSSLRQCLFLLETQNPVSGQITGLRHLPISWRQAQIPLVFAAFRQIMPLQE